MRAQNWKILLIHGIGFFTPESVHKDVADQLEKHGVSRDRVIPFNWDSVTTTFFPRDPFFAARAPNLRFVAEVNTGIIQSAHLGFLSASNGYAGTSPPIILVHNFLAFLLHVLPSWSRDPFGWGWSLPFGNTEQTYHWTEPAPSMTGRGCGCN